jgi:AcrR family transcriptional regulator
MRKTKEIRQDEIAAAALKLLSEEGPQQLTARNLGQRVGMDGSSLFRHFENKGQILHAALDQFEAVLDATIPAEQPSWSSLHEFFVRRLALVQARPEIIQLAFNQHLLSGAGEHEHAARVRDVVQRSVSFVRACLEDAQASGLISARIPASAQVWVVTGMLRGASLGSMQPPPTPEQAWQWLAATLIRGEDNP